MLYDAVSSVGSDDDGIATYFRCCIALNSIRIVVEYASDAARVFKKNTYSLQ